MKARMKKAMGLVLSIALALGSLAACSKNETQSPPSSPSSSASAQPSGKASPITVTTVGCTTGSEKFKPGETQEDNVTTRWAKDKFGMNIKYLWVTSAEQCSTKLRLSLTSNEPLPDVLYTADLELASNLIEAGKLMDIGEAFEKYASPELKKTLENSSLWFKVMKNGKRFAIPMLGNRFQNESVLWMREDWLTKFNLQPPKTIEDLEHIMDVFVNQDPDGNGQKDTIGIASGLKSGFTSYLGDVSWLFGAYGSLPEYFMKDNAGNITYGSIMPGAKQALAKLQDWMKKGYISKEAFSNDGNKEAEAVNVGKAGVIGGAYWILGWPLSEVGKNSPGGKLKPYPLPGGADGKVVRRGMDIDSAFVLVNKDFKHIDTLFAYMNKLYEGFNRLPGTELEKGFFEGYDYKMENGEPVYVGDGIIDIQRHFIFPPPKDPDATLNANLTVVRGEEPKTAIEKSVKKYGTPEVREAFSILSQQKDGAVYNLFKGMPTETMKTKWEYLRKIESETFSKIIFGEKPLDEFDKFVTEWKAAGGDQIIKEVTERYKSNGGK